MNPTERRILVATLHLLHSDDPAERDNAARVACEMLGSMGENWESVITIPPGSPFAVHQGDNFLSTAVALLQRPALLDEADARFLRKICGWKKLGAEQREQLANIVERIADAEGGEA